MTTTPAPADLTVPCPPPSLSPWARLETTNARDYFRIVLEREAARVPAPGGSV